MLTVDVVRDGVIEALADPNAISDHVGRDDGLVWVDVVDPTDGDLETIQREFDLHPLAMADVRHRNQRPKIELYPTHAFLVGYAHDVDALDLPEVEVFIGPDWLVSVRSRNEAGRAFDAGPARERYGRMCGRDGGVGLLLWTLLDDMVDGYFDLVEQAEDELAGIESMLFSEYGEDDQGDVDTDGRAMAKLDRAMQSELLDLRRRLIAMRRKVVPMREVVLGILRREIPWIADDALIYFQDVLDHLLRIVDEIDSQRELLGNVVDAHLALVANRTNDVMKKTSSWGAILIVATLIAGIYGMNFRNMPELGWRFGYPGAIASMLMVTGAMYVYFKRKGWL